jgi:hypothetical protein
MQTLPDNTTVIEGPISLYWFDELGILHSRVKDTPITPEKMRATMDLYDEMRGDKKLVMLVDSTSVHPQDKETKEILEKEMVHKVKAMALVSRSQVGKIISNIFIKLTHQQFPVKVFITETEAANWLKQFL